MVEEVLGRAFREALVYAAEIHAVQSRKQAPDEANEPAVPYVGHLLGAAALVIGEGGSQDEVIAALLHDAIEDTEVTEQDLRERFGGDVAAIVSGCSDTDVVPKPPWRERKEAYLAQLEAAGPSVLRVSNADKVDNGRAILRDLREIGTRVFDRFTGGKDGTLWYYRSLAEVFARRNPGYLADELGRLVDEIETLAVADAAR